MKKIKAARIVDGFARIKILVLGDLMLDRYLWGNVDRISPEAPVPIVHVHKETNNLGGAANVATCIRALGAKASLVGIIGDDQYAEQFKRNLTKSKIPISGLVSSSDRPTTIKTRIVAHSQQIVRIDREDISEIGDDLVDRLLAKIGRLIRNVDGVIVSDYGKGVITSDLLAELIPMVTRAGKFIAVDPKEIHFMNYSNVSVITPNHHEAGFVSGRRITSDKILADVGWNLVNLLNLESLLITRGEKGMALFERDRRLTLIPAEGKTVYDVTGAGDTVIAALTVARTSGATMTEAAFISNVAAGLAVAKFGTAKVTKDELMIALSGR